MIRRAETRGELLWRPLFTGSRGGVVQLFINKNRIRFTKRIPLRNNEDFESAMKILRDKVYCIVHLKNKKNPDLARIAQYVIDATNVVEITNNKSL